MAKKQTSSFPMQRVIIILLVLAVVGLVAKLYMLMEDQKKEIALAREANTTVKLPANAVKITECIAHEGEHWVEPDKVPNGPYYVVYNGRVLSTEYMLGPEQIPGEALAKGTPDQFMKYIQTNNLSLGQFVDEVRLALPLPPTVYKTLHIGWTAPHVGMLKPHYDIHFDLVTDEELKSVCPESRIEDVYSPSVLETINQNKIPFPGQ